MHIFLPVDLMKKVFIKARGVDGVGVGSVGSSTVGSTTVLRLARNFLGRRIITATVVQKRMVT